MARFLHSVTKIFKPVSHVIFDIDGLLLRTEDIYYQIDKQVIEKYSKTYPMDVRMKVLGRTENESARIIVEDCQLPITPEQFGKEVKLLQKTLLKNCKLMPGAERLIRHLSENNIPMAVATSSGEECVKVKTSNYKELFSLFSHIVMASSDPLVPRGKPAPDIFLECAERFPDKPDKSKCLVFEDAPNGVKAAVSAGMQVVLVPDTQISEKDKEQATIVLNSLTEFKPQLFSLPPF